MQAGGAAASLLLSPSGIGPFPPVLFPRLMQPMESTPPSVPVESKRVLCGVLGLLIGGLGIHRFILGDVTGGILRIVVTVATCGLGGIIGFIEGIIYLTKSDAEFVSTYQVGKKGWF